MSGNSEKDHFPAEVHGFYSLVQLNSYFQSIIILLKDVSLLLTHGEEPDQVIRRDKA